MKIPVDIPFSEQDTKSRHTRPDREMTRDIRIGILEF